MDKNSLQRECDVSGWTYLETTTSGIFIGIPGTVAGGDADQNGWSAAVYYWPGPGGMVRGHGPIRRIVAILSLLAECGAE